MADGFYAELPARGVIEIAGEDRVAFLQGLVSNDVAKVDAEHAIYAALLTAQGRYLFDFFIVAIGDALYLDTEAARVPDLLRRLSIYKLRSKVTLADAGPRIAVAAAWGQNSGLGLDTTGDARPFAGGIAYRDPRLADLGWRFCLPRPIAAIDGFAHADEAAYDRHRLQFGVPDGSRDLGIEKALLLENGFDELNGIDWKKGCYMGQELTARTKYRGLVKKRLVPVSADGPLPAPGTLVMAGSDEAGEIRSSRDGRALALLRLDTLDKTLLTGSVRITPEKPNWAKF